MNKTLILKIGGEGGGADVYGALDNGTWTFWLEGTHMDWDENDEEIWRSYTTEPVPDFLAALPDNWWMWCPTDPPHVDFVDRLREEYDRCSKTMGEDFQYSHERWPEMLNHG